MNIYMNSFDQDLKFYDVYPNAYHRFRRLNAKNEVNPIETTYESSGLLDLKVKRLKRNAVTVRRSTLFGG